MTPIHVQTVLDNLVIGLPKYALAIDKKTMNIVATTGLGYEKANVADLGIDVDKVKSDFDGVFIINGKYYYAGVSESGDLYLMPLARSTDNVNALAISCKLALFSIVTFILFVLIAMSGYKKEILEISSDKSKEAEVEKAADDKSIENKVKGLFANIIKTQDKSDLKRETILLLLRNALKYACALVFLYVGLEIFGVDTKALWASAGVLSLMIGFGAKDLIGDIIAGLFIIFEGAYRIGNWVWVGDWYGQVHEIGLRYTKIVFHTETKIFNKSEIRNIICSDHGSVREIVNVPIPYEIDLLEIKKLFDREFPIMAPKISGIIKAPQYQSVNSFDDSSIMVYIVMYCDPSKRKRALRDLRTEIKLLFDRNGISIPYNHVVVSDYKDEINTFVYEPKEGEGVENNE